MTGRMMRRYLVGTSIIQEEDLTEAVALLVRDLDVQQSP